jgi:hypothetical protein
MKQTKTNPKNRRHHYRMQTEKMMNLRCHTIISLALFCAFAASSQLAVTVSPLKLGANKAIVPLTMKNGFSQNVESARAVVFLVDDQGKVMGQPTTRWVIGGTQDKPGLAVGATNAFYFGVPLDKSLATTNLTAKVQFTRVILEGGKLADAVKDV